jgi:hypothetical protein
MSDELREFVQKVYAMRCAQLRFFHKGRKREDLDEARRLEREVDRMLPRVCEGARRPAEAPGLFDDAAQKAGA